MINLRYHVVSLVAVFLALTVGIVMGSTVIDRVTVDALNRRVTSVSRSVRAAEAENRRLNSQLQLVQGFAEQARDQIVERRLDGVPVLVLAVTGIDRKPVDGLRDALAASQARRVGTVWFTAKMRLDNDADVRAMAGALGVAPDRLDVLGIARADALRRQALDAVATAVEGGDVPNPLPALGAAGFVTFENPAGPSPTATGIPTLPALPGPGARVVLVSGAGADVGDDQVAVPLADSLARLPGRLVAAEAGRDTPGGRGVFVGLLRANPGVSPYLSTVDDLESPMGQAATVLALEDLAVPRTGHFGVGPGASRLVPASRP